MLPTRNEMIEFIKENEFDKIVNYMINIKNINLNRVTKYVNHYWERNFELISDRELKQYIDKRQTYGWDFNPGEWWWLEIGAFGNLNKAAEKLGFID